MRQIYLALALAGALSCMQAAFGQAPPTLEELPPPPMPDRVEEGESLEPEVTIRATPRGTVLEYRLHGQLYMVKVYPRRGFPYYLIDADGDGRLETTSHELAPNFVIPAWVLYRW